LYEKESQHESKHQQTATRRVGPFIFIVNSGESRLRSEDRSEAGDRRAMGVLVVANAAQHENAAILTFTNYVNFSSLASLAAAH
jgi:hypothetical protein